MPIKLKTERYDTDDWIVYHDGEEIGMLTRERPTRYADWPYTGLVEDRTKPYDWSFDGQDLRTGKRMDYSWSGGTVHDAKRHVAHWLESLE